ncbi:hypothetical protein CKAH01_13901 [Colletotrichum kahawae]|uniref:Uncharacterized protein n=1 Tax=Colletotrichum kahawae TaxID=34407 RepID=A0AAD9YMJ0_COLKA|nr:hypothetical protein CKAH01_13901 [Colletotrichum kahawae]
MGGSVFTAGDRPLNTPRMPPEVYERVKAECHAALRKIYLCVASPIEGPAKRDYGDIDILVALERSIILGGSHSDYQPFGKDGKKDACKAIQEALGAPFLKIENQTDHYAVRWPDASPLAEGDDTSTSSPERYCQIDIAICDNLEQVHWKLFKHAHGDLWSILGTIIRPYGLTVDEESLWVRIVEMEKFDKKRARVLLTQDPYEILSFLGLAADSHIWDSAFESLEDMYEYAATCRFFCSLPLSAQSSPAAPATPTSTVSSAATTSVKSPASSSSLPPSTPASAIPSSRSPAAAPPATPSTQTSTSTADVQTPEPSKKKLNHSDRKRMNSRKAYSDFINEFIPQCRKEGRFIQVPGTIKSVRAEAFERFPGVKEVFEARHIDFLNDQDILTIMAKLKSSWIPAIDTTDPRQCQYRGCQTKALKRIIFEGNDSYGGIVPEEPLKDGSGRWNVDRVEEFVKKHMDAIGIIAYEQNQQAYAKRKRREEREEQHKNHLNGCKTPKLTESGVCEACGRGTTGEVEA